MRGDVGEGGVDQTERKRDGRDLVGGVIDRDLGLK